MTIRNLIILSQLTPPAQRTHVLQRPRVVQALKHAIKYPLSIIEAGTGYGKSTAIISFISSLSRPVFWFTISGTDRDPKLFLAKFFSAFNQLGYAIGEKALRILDSPDSTPMEALIAFVNAVATQLNQEALIIVDDFHRVRDVKEIMRHIDWLIENLPKNLHMILATRHSLHFASMPKWHVKGSLHVIDKNVLTFTREEIGQLFKIQYQMDLSSEAVDQLFQKTEGWAIGLQMVWQTLQRNPEMSLKQVLEDDRMSRTALFDYLAEEVMGRLETDLQGFLVRTSILSKLESASCDFLLNINNSDQLLRQVQSAGLFIEELRPGVYRYHQIFREFLLNRLQNDVKLKEELHRKIASYFRAHEYWEEAIYHLLSVGDYHQTNQILENIGEKLIKEGRHESINYWIQMIPDAFWQQYPYLLFLLGEVKRYQGHFEQALDHYHASERIYRDSGHPWGISKALRGQAQVFLDTIRPNNADQLLQDALKLIDPAESPQEVANLLVLTAENQLNLGFPESAEALLEQARILQTDLETETDLIQARIYLRTGRIDQGIQILNQRESKPSPLPLSRPQRFHRESSLLLSLFYAIKGDLEKTQMYARKGIAIGKALQSTFVQSVGYMRLGHALQLEGQNPITSEGFEKAITYYQESIQKVDVTRIHVEPLWGMCRALGYSHQIDAAEKQALESLAIAKKAGDEWISILIQLSLGAGEIMAHQYEKAQQFLTSAEMASLKVKDPFTLTTARMWLALKAWQQGYQNTAFTYLEKTLQGIQEHHYGFLLKRETLLGLKDRERIFPLLIAAKNEIKPGDYLEELLKERHFESIDYHPGYTLWVQTFGAFNVWRGHKKIAPEMWKREKARQLFQFLVAYREKWIHRDQLNSMLWADSPVENAANYFKVIFNALNQVLEPERPRGEPSFFILRQQDRYRLNPNARIMVDADLFISDSQSESMIAKESALHLYQGRYFEDTYVQEWFTVDEQYYHQQFLQTAQEVSEYLYNKAEYEKSLELTYQILSIDQLVEFAYRLQMRIFHEMGRYAMIHEVYHQCQMALKTILEGDPSPETTNLYEKLRTTHQN